MREHPPEGRRFRLAITPVPRDVLDVPDPNREESDRRFQDLRKSALTRDQFLCGGCGFRDMVTQANKNTIARYIDVHHLDHDHGNNDPGNLTAVCVICHDVMEVGFARPHRRGCVLLAGWIAQDALVNMARTVMVAIHQQGQYADAARSCYAGLLAQARDETVIAMSGHSGWLDEDDGEDLSLPRFGEFLRQSPLMADPAAADLLEDARYFPLLDGYPHAAAHWARAAYAQLPESDWANIAAQIADPQQ